MLEKKLAAVLRLLPTRREDFEALERRDDTKFLNLAVDEVEAEDALSALRNVLCPSNSSNSSGRKGKGAGSSGSNEGSNAGSGCARLSWALLASSSTSLLRRFPDDGGDDDDDDDDNNGDAADGARTTGGDKDEEGEAAGADTLSVQRALMVCLYRCMMLTTKARAGSSTASPTSTAWAAAEIYTALLCRPDASAYGVFHPAPFGLVLNVMHNWCKNSKTYATGGAGGDASVAKEGGRGAGKKGTKGAASKRKRKAAGKQGGRGDEDFEGGDDDDDNEDDGGGDGGAENDDDDGAADSDEPTSAVGRLSVGGPQVPVRLQSLLLQVQQAVATVGIENHQEIVAKLAEVQVAVMVVAVLEDRKPLLKCVLGAMEGLAKCNTGPHGTTAAVVQAMLPVILMQGGKPGVPAKQKDRLKAHKQAVSAVVVLIKAVPATHTENYPPREDTEAAAETEDSQQEQATGTENSEKETAKGGKKKKTKKKGGDDDDDDDDDGDGDFDGNKENRSGNGRGKTKGNKGGDAAATATATAAAAARARAEDPASFCAFLVLLQHLCVSVPEKADIRKRVTSAICAFAAVVSLTIRRRFIEFVVKLGLSAKVLHRGFAIELSSKLLQEGWLWTDSEPTPGGAESEATPSDSLIEECSGGGGEGGGGGGGACSDGKASSLFEVVVSRCGDKAPTVRSKAAAALCSLMELITAGEQGLTASEHQQDKEVRLQEKGYTSADDEGGDDEEEESAASSGGRRGAGGGGARRGSGGRQAGSRSGGAHYPPGLREMASEMSDGDSAVIIMLRQRIVDEKATVRRHAVSAMEALLLLQRQRRQRRGWSGPPSSSLAAANNDVDDVEVRGVTFAATGGGGGDDASGKAGDILLLEERCNDVSLSTRKASLVALSNLLLVSPKDEVVQLAWVRAVLPLVSDPESSCQVRVVEMVHDVIVKRVIRWHDVTVKSKARKGRGSAEPTEEGDDESDDHNCTSVWGLLSKMAMGDVNQCLNKAIHVLCTAGRAVTATAIANFQSGPVLAALRDAAVMGLPATTVEGADKMVTNDDEKENNGDAADEDGESQGDDAAAAKASAADDRLIALSSGLSATDKAAMRRGCWVLLEAFLTSSQGASVTSGGAVVLSTAGEGEGSSSAKGKGKGKGKGGGSGGSSGSSSGSGGKRGGKGAPLDAMFVVRCWAEIKVDMLGDGRGGVVGGEAAQADGRRVLMVMASLAASIPAAVASRLADELLELLHNLTTEPRTSAAVVKALTQLCLSKADSAQAGSAMCEQWINQALPVWEEVLQRFVKTGTASLAANSDADGPLAMDLVKRAVFLVGEAVMVGFQGDEDGPKGSSGGGDEGAGKPRKLKLKISASLVKVIQVLLPPFLPAAKGSERGPSVPKAVRALAFVTLGKLCLLDRSLAKQSISLLVRELSTAESAAVRSNALVVLGDLCIRYTAMVDRHIPAMAVCLQDAHPLVRRHAIVLVSQLLLQDYIKWRGLLLYRFMATMVDQDDSISHLGTFTITSPLLTKYPNLFVSNFVECVFVLNNYSEHPIYATAIALGAEAGGSVGMDGINVAGDEATQVEKRMRIYRVLLQHMNEEAKINVTAKLAQEVLGAAVDGHLPAAVTAVTEKEILVKRKAENVIRDTFMVLSSPDISVGGRAGAAAGAEGGAGVDEDLDDDGGGGGAGGGAAAATGGGAVLAAAKTKLLAKMSRKHLIEHVVPVLISLKHMLERAHSPLLKELMSYFRDLLKQYKGEVKEVLDKDANLAAEIEYDLKQYEKEEERLRKIAAAQAAMQAAAQAAIDAAAARATDSPAAHGTTRPATPGTPQRGVGGHLSANRGYGDRRLSADGGRTPLSMRRLSAVKLRHSGMRRDGQLQVRTPSQAVTAACSKSGKKIRPAGLTPVRLVAKLNSGEGEEGSSSSAKSASEGGAKGADVLIIAPELTGGDALGAGGEGVVRKGARASTMRRWSVQVAPPEADKEKEGRGGDEADGEDDDDEEEEYSTVRERGKKVKGKATRAKRNDAMEDSEDDAAGEGEDDVDGSGGKKKAASKPKAKKGGGAAATKAAAKKKGAKAGPKAKAEETDGSRKSKRQRA